MSERAYSTSLLTRLRGSFGSRRDLAICLWFGICVPFDVGGNSLPADDVSDGVGNTVN